MKTAKRIKHMRKGKPFTNAVFAEVGLAAPYRLQALQVGPDLP